MRDALGLVGVMVATSRRWLTSSFARLWAAIIAVILTLPVVAARNSGFRGIDMAIEAMSKIFYPSILLTNTRVQIGFYKFLYFIIIFAVTNWVLLKLFNKDNKDPNGKRTANIVAFAFAAIAAWFMPTGVAQASAGLITGIFNALIPVGLAAGAIYLAFYTFGGKDAEWWKHLLGASILILCIIILTWVTSVV